MKVETTVRLVGGGLDRSIPAVTRGRVKAHYKEGLIKDKKDIRQDFANYSLQAILRMRKKASTGIRRQKKQSHLSLVSVKHGKN